MCFGKKQSTSYQYNHSVIERRGSEAVGLLPPLESQWEEVSVPGGNLRKMPGSLTPGAKPGVSCGIKPPGLGFLPALGLCAALTSTDRDSSGLFRDQKSTL